MVIFRMCLPIYVILPLFDNGDVVYGNCSAITLNRLQMLQTRGARMFFRL